MNMETMPTEYVAVTARGEGSHGLSSAQTPRDIRVPSVMQVTTMILVLKVALAMFGFRRVVAWIGQRVQPIPSTCMVDPEAVRAPEHAVAMAAALYPGRARCLEQSLVLYYLLRRQGIAVRYRQGVIARPFEAHAWVEYRGEVINDIPEHARRFAPLPDRLP